MDLGISNKKALVLGGAGGLGSAISVALAREGVQVAVADLNAEALELCMRGMPAVEGRHVSLLWDIGALTEVDSQITRLEAEWGCIDILVNNTGGPPPSAAYGLDEKVWRHHFEKMVLSVIKITDRVLAGMKERCWGRIITSTSSGVVAPIPNLAVSNALRLALLGWSKSLAREVASSGITVNVAVPGRIATDRIRSLDKLKADREERMLESVVAESAALIPMGRYGTPDEYANAIVFLASEAASYITGTVVKVDGGYIPSI